MKRAIALMLCLLCLTAWTPWGGAQAEGVWAAIDGGSADRVHLRAEPSAEAASLGLYFTGTLVACEAAPAAEWTKVVIGAQTGYIKTEFLRWGAALDGVAAKQPLGRVQASGWVNVRSGPSLVETAVGRLEPGDTVTVQGETATHWYYVATPDAAGYVAAAFIALTGETAPPALRAYCGELAPYGPVMTGEATFLSVSDRRMMRLGQVGADLADMAVTFSQFAMADVDADGLPEVIVKLSIGSDDYGFEILDARDGAIYGYTLVYRSLIDLKADGTFSYASGAADEGFGTLALEDGGHSIIPLACSVPEDGGVRFYQQGSAIDQARYYQLLDSQEAKPSALWYDLTDANIVMVLGWQ